MHCAIMYTGYTLTAVWYLRAMVYNDIVYLIFTFEKSANPTSFSSLLTSM